MCLSVSLGVDLHGKFLPFSRNCLIGSLDTHSPTTFILSVIKLLHKYFIKCGGQNLKNIFLLNHTMYAFSLVMFSFLLLFDWEMPKSQTIDFILNPACPK